MEHSSGSRSKGGKRVHFAQVDPSSGAPPRAVLVLAAAVRAAVGAERFALRVSDASAHGSDTSSAAQAARDADIVVFAGGHRASGALASALRTLESTLGPERPPVCVALIGESAERAEGLLKGSGFHLVVRGDAEEVLPVLVSGLVEGRTDWAGQRGVSWRDGAGQVHHERAAVAPLADPMPAWDLVDLSLYSSASHGRVARTLERIGVPRARNLRTATITTTRACTPDCPTCHGSFGGSRPRDRSVSDVVHEVRELSRQHGLRELRIADHGFDARPERALEVVRALQEVRSAAGPRQLRVSFPRGFRGEDLPRELVDALLELGVRRFVLPIGTASPRLQRLFKTNIDPDRVATSLATIDRAGGIGHLRIELGLPTETTGEVAHTIRWASRSRAHTATFARGSERALRPTAHPFSGSHRPANRPGGEIDDFRNLRRRALVSFYGSPTRAARTLRAAFGRSLGGATARTLDLARPRPSAQSADLPATTR